MNIYKKSLALGLFIRFGIILYGEWHDKNLHVPFTDIDYKVFSDAARYIATGESPYKRHTYRYPPLLAWILVPNVLFPLYGKFLFSLIDIFNSILIKELVRSQGFSELTILRCTQTWIFNPLSIIISARGNFDSIISFTVLLTVLLLLNRQPIFAGICLAVSIHIRLYPIIFSLPMYLSLSEESNDKSQKVLHFVKKLYPNKSQLILTISCVTCLILLTSFSYYFYSTEYLQESILYHLKRKDTRHNFSVYFYLLYLEPNQSPVLLFLPQFFLLIALAFVYGQKSTLLFCIFAQTFVFVSYNPVITSQYFIWYLSLLTVNLPRFDLTLLEAGKLTLFWLFAQLTWLIPAYLLEFRGRNTFLYIWFQGIGFFCANIAVLVKLVKQFRIKVEMKNL